LKIRKRGNRAIIEDPQTPPETIESRIEKVLLILIGPVLGYLATTGLTWVIVWLINTIFGIHFHPNFWLLGLLVYLILLLLKDIFGGKK